MFPNLAHIYGPIYLNCYGSMIAIGLLVFRYLLLKNPARSKILTTEQFDNILLISIPIAILGGRLLWAFGSWSELSSPLDILALWEPGYSVLGALLAILIFLPAYLKYQKISGLKLLDLAAIYTPLLHSISRIGCFLAGCCYGKITNLPWGVIYTHPDVLVPELLKFTKIHPTQLYSSVLLLGIFLFMYYFAQKYFTKPGQLTGIYLILAGLERFIVDFWRADQELLSWCTPLGLQQVIALGIITAGIGLYSYTKNKS